MQQYKHFHCFSFCISAHKHMNSCFPLHGPVAEIKGKLERSDKALKSKCNIYIPPFPSQIYK